MSITHTSSLLIRSTICARISWTSPQDSSCILSMTTIFLPELCLIHKSSSLTLLAAAPLTARAEDDQNQFVELTEEHVSLEKTEYEYTGEEIRPNVTVRVEDTLLTLGKEYSLDYADNIEVGEGKVIVTGIATGGYTGTVEVGFTITEKETEPTPIALEESHVKLDKTEFTYEGKAVEPAVTVTVEDKVLVKDTDYTLTFENNDKAGDAYAVITAVEGSGYTGAVRVKFTIQEAPKAPEYTITKGDAAKWTLKSTKTLSFTASGDFDKFSSCLCIIIISVFIHFYFYYL